MTALRSTLEPTVVAALARLRAHDDNLLSIGTNERAITHRLACYLQAALPAWDVDCEYNRDGREPKRAVLPLSRVATNELKARTVYPDIIVHKRGPLGPNLLVIELKVDAADDDREWDLRKLRAYHDEFDYQHGVFIDIRIDDTGAVDCVHEWVYEPPSDG